MATTIARLLMGTAVAFPLIIVGATPAFAAPQSPLSADCLQGPPSASIPPDLQPDFNNRCTPADDFSQYGDPTLADCAPMEPLWIADPYDQNDHPPIGCVRSLQTALDIAGFSLLVDGQYGVETQGAVCAFQAASSLQVTGDADPSTIAAIAPWQTAAPALSGNGSENPTCPPTVQGPPPTAAAEAGEHPEAPEVEVPGSEDDDAPRAVEPVEPPVF